MNNIIYYKIDCQYSHTYYIKDFLTSQISPKEYKDNLIEKLGHYITNGYHYYYTNNKSFYFRFNLDRITIKEIKFINMTFIHNNKFEDYLIEQTRDNKINKLLDV